ncbi:MAG TPA: PKD domain-containing protein [Gemmatimonadales bacterium]|nr:PKD domain-containing protein [Gemmatimonadales bacterium]
MSLALASLATGCGGGDLVVPNNDSAISIQVVEGDGQRGAVGEPLTSPVVVQVTDGGGDPVEGVTVAFALVSAGTGAEITPATARTDADGRAQAHVLLGDKVGLQTGEARVTGGSDPVTTFAALAVSGTGGGNPPTAAFTWDCAALACRFSDASTDNGSVTAWLWTFGDGSTSTERNPSHDYSRAGTYGVALTVTDAEDLSDIATNQVTATAPTPSNASPHAEFAVSCQQLTCTFTDQSTDPDGTVASWRWDFGDGATSTQRSPSRTFAAAGQYTVSLRVTDDDGASDTRSHPANPSAPTASNDPPHAEFEVTCQDLRCTFVDRSDDPDGAVASWSWDFGDGSTSSERNPSHTYASAGRFTVLLMVTDDKGAADTRTHTAEPTAPPTDANEPPHADFDVHCDHLTCAFVDQSTDDDGVIVSRQWSFGDGSSSTESNPTHTYGSPGHYNASLTVTDDDGATSSKDRRADVKK